MEPMAAVEDSRGVDISQIRRGLRMSVPERVREMVQVANALMAVQDRSRASTQRGA